MSDASHDNFTHVRDYMRLEKEQPVSFKRDVMELRLIERRDDEKDQSKEPDHFARLFRKQDELAREQIKRNLEWQKTQLESQKISIEMGQIDGEAKEEIAELDDKISKLDRLIDNASNSLLPLQDNNIRIANSGGAIVSSAGLTRTMATVNMSAHAAEVWEHYSESVQRMNGRDHAADASRGRLNDLAQKYGFNNRQYDRQYADIDAQRAAAKKKGDIFGYSSLTLGRRHLENEEALSTVEGIIKKNGSKEDVDKGLTEWMGAATRRVDELEQFDQTYKKEQERLSQLLTQAKPEERAAIEQQMQTMTAKYQRDRQNAVSQIHKDNEKAGELSSQGASQNMKEEVDTFTTTLNQRVSNLTEQNNQLEQRADAAKIAASEAETQNTVNDILALDLSDEKPGEKKAYAKSILDTLSPAAKNQLGAVSKSFKQAGVSDPSQQSNKGIKETDTSVKLAVAEAKAEDTKKPSHAPAKEQTATASAKA